MNTFVNQATKLLAEKPELFELYECVGDAKYNAIIADFIMRRNLASEPEIFTVLINRLRSRFVQSEIMTSITVFTNLRW